MDTRSKLVGLFLALLSFGSLAQYAAVSPVAAFTGAAGAYFYKAAANDAVFGSMIKVAEAGVVTVGGNALKVPAAMRFAANAPIYAARVAFANPALAVGIGVAGAIAAYYAQQSFEVDNGIWKKRVGGSFCTSGCYEYSTSFFGFASPKFNVLGDLVSWVVQQYKVSVPTRTYRLNHVDQSGGAINIFLDMIGNEPGALWNPNFQSVPGDRVTIPPWDSSSLVPVLLPEFETAPYPPGFPDGMPQALPVPLPVGDPVLFPIGDPVKESHVWPNSDPVTDPLPVPQPRRVPLGDPVPVPNTNPQKYTSPAIDVVPSPTLNDPWRVSLQPKDVTSESPVPIPVGEPVPTAPGSPEATPKTPDLCEAHPEILACAKFKPDELAPVDLNNRNVDMTITKDTGWGPSGGGSCPADKPITVMGKTLTFSMSMLCDFARGINPLFIAFAWLSAGMAFIGMSKGK